MPWRISSSAICLISSLSILLGTYNLFYWTTNIRVQVFTNMHSLWRDKKWADATIVMGDCTWNVHRWVVCKQSDYFNKVFEGQFLVGALLSRYSKPFFSAVDADNYLSQESSEKKVDLTGNPFAADEVNNLLIFLYTAQDKGFISQNILRVYGVADYFQVAHLRYRALRRLHSLFDFSAHNRFWDNYRDLALGSIHQFPVGECQKVLVEVTAKHITAIINEVSTELWDKLKAADPSIVEQVLKACFPKEQYDTLRECQFIKEEDCAAARAAQAFDDILSSRGSCCNPPGPRSPSPGLSLETMLIWGGCTRLDLLAKFITVLG